MKRVEYFSESWMTAKESPTPISEEKKTNRRHKRYKRYKRHEYRDLWFYRWGKSIVSVKNNEE